MKTTPRSALLIATVLLAAGPACSDTSNNGIGASDANDDLRHRHGDAGATTSPDAGTADAGSTTSSDGGTIDAAPSDAGAPALVPTLYVSPSGSDANPGTTADKPFRTIQKAASVATAGAVVSVAAGKYAESITLTTSGTATAPIVFLGNGVAEIAHPDRTGFDVNADYVILDGFVFDLTATTGAVAVDIDSDRHHDTIRNFVIENRGPDAYVPFVTDTGSHDVLITKNTIKDVYNLEAVGYIWGHDHVISHNTITNYQMDYTVVHADFLQTFGCPGWDSYNILAEDNLIANSDNQFFNLESNNGWNGAYCTTPSPSTFHDWTFRNNVTVNMTGAGFSHIPATHIYDNVFFNSGNGDYAIGFYSGADGNADGSDMYNNVIIGDTQPASTGGASVAVANNYVTTPSGGASLFIDAANGNFHPVAGSPLIGAGKNLTAICGAFPDADGTPRPITGAWTIGAYEQ